MLSLENIRNICAGGIAIGEPLARFTTFRIGGPADMRIAPASVEDLRRLTAYLRENASPFIVIGNGSNILVSDEGFRGVAITLGEAFSEVDHRDGIVTAGAATRLSTFVEYCVTNGFAGVEMLAGIPGTIGGAIVMNAGAHGGETSDTVLDVTVVRDGSVTVLDAAQCGFAYRRSALRDDIVVSARFKPPAGDTEQLRARRRALLEHRNATQPTTRPNAGSIFRNPAGAHAGRLVEDAGLKGRRVGDAEVSRMHGNFIVNTGSATAADVTRLINIVRAEVFARTGITLELELRLVGFGADPILPLPSDPA